MRPIDAEALKIAFHEEWDGVCVWDESGETTANEFCNIVDLMPPVDAVEVVRCKDCKHYKPIQGLDADCRHWCGYCDPTDFCSYGVRREDNE